MSDSRAIGVFDSGLGGLTVTKELIKRLPYEDIIYFGDTGRVPYGNRSRETIKKYALEDENFLLKQNVKLIVAACGTVSSVAADTAKALPVPFFEMVSYAAYSAVKATKNKVIGVIGTAATVNSGSHKRKISEIMPDATVIANSCPFFVPLVEEGWYSPDDIIVKSTVERYLAPIISAGADTLILGCTHYPILSDAIKSVTGNKMTLINPGVSVAEAVADYLTDNNVATENTENITHKFYVSDKPQSFRKTASILLGEEINEKKVEQIHIG